MSQLERIAEILLKEIGEDPGRDGLIRTPERFRRSIEYLTQGYQEDPGKILNAAVFEESYNEMLIVKDIDFYSLCEHHLLPFFGKAHIAYVPDGRIVGLSKLARLVEVFARRLQIQERMTQQIAAEIQNVLKPKGVGVVLEAQHLCMMMRGVQKQNSCAISSAMLGEFSSDSKTRSEFMELIRHSRREI